MFPDTHRVIGRILSKKTHEYLDFKLDVKALKYGSIFPDISSMIFKLPHNHTQSIDAVWMMIEGLWSEPVPTDRKTEKTYARQLGIIMHYIADYFCTAHNQQRYKKNIRHIFYEINLSLVFRRTIREVLRSLDEHPLFPVQTLPQLKKYLRDTYYDFMHQPEHPLHDIEYSLKACITLTLSLVWRLQASSLEIAA